MAQLVFEIKNQWISRTDTFKPVAKSKNYLYAQFNFLTDEWVGVQTAIFRNKTSAYEQIIGQDGTCLVPWEVIDVEGDSEIFVSVFCGDLVTANKARVHVYDTGYGDDLESDTPPTPSVYEQILNRMAGIEEDMDDATQRAETAAESAEYAAEHYPIIMDEYWYVWDIIEHEYVDTGIKAEAHDGTSATVDVEQIVGGHRVIITDVSGEHVFDVPDGRDGTDGRGIASLEKTSTSGDVDQYTMTFSDDSEPFVYYVTNGASATISTRAITNGYRLTITDKNGTRAIDVLNGAQGDPGNGIRSIDKIGSYENYDYYEIRMTNGNHTSFTVTNGYSPTVEIVNITGGHKVIITDINGAHSFDVMDGAGGGVAIHICSSSEYDHTTGVPTIQNPEENTFYLVPSSESATHDMFVEWVYVNNAWEMFGSASIDLSNYATKTDLNTKVDKVTGKGLSTNDYTTEEKNKLSGIETGAKANVQSDWNQTDTSADDYIKNKPEIPSAVTVDDELSDTSENPVQNKVIVKALKDKADIIFSNASGAIASFVDGADGLPMESVIAHIEPVQSGSGDPSPTNVRPITGWTQAKIVRTGKNLISGDLYQTNGNDNTVYFSTGGASVFTTYLKSGTYTFSIEYSSARNDYPNLYFREQSGASNINIGALESSITFNVETEGLYRFWLYSNTSTKSPIYKTDISSFQLEIGSTASPYKPYQGETVTIDLNGTVYGGYVDLVSGKLMVDRAYVDLGTLAWSKTSSATSKTYFRSTNELSGAKPSAGNTIVPNMLCSIYKTDTWSNTLDKQGYDKSITLGWASKSYLAICDTNYIDSTANEFQTAMSGVQLVYELATPIEYDLTPQEIRSLFGANNVWADTGDTDVTYRADTKLYLESHAPKVDDVQVNGTSIVNQGVANVPVASGNDLGAVAIGTGLSINAQGKVFTEKATSSQAKAGTSNYYPIVPSNQHESTFYGLAKAASDTTQSQSSNPVGTYTDAAKQKINAMLEPQFRLIKTINITSDTGYFHILADDNNNPFSLTELILYFDSILGSSNGNVGISVNNGTVAATNAFLAVNGLLHSSTVQHRAALLRVVGGRFFGEAISQSVSQNYSPATMATSLNATGIIPCSNIEEIYIKSFNSFNFTSGTITIYGR